ncbi:ABC transporter permease subunit [Phytohabitans aurantiacus]|uniref:Transporter n=1 Tax=Phytohabitans aurantiacus TaxID=3016789 RepID=A0ABQ5QV93_9ACTN|nr:ABC transporter permease subunit [Phytohabitans aurantiacus]GLH98177.1 transporter [Phytohabitans aurantiacus]
MIWLTWRQHRWQLIGIGALLAVYWGYLLSAGVRARDALSGCASLGGDAHVPPSCFEASNTVDATFNTMGEVVMFGNLLPLAMGMFVGAPLISRELELGTYRLAFTQSVSRARWLAVKLGALAAAAALLGAVTGAVVSWSRAGFGSMFAAAPFGDDVVFSQSGAVPAATWVFVLLVGAAIGVLVRRTTMAMAVTLVVLPLAFAGLILLRPHYMPPAERLVDGGDMIQDGVSRNDSRGWIFSTSYVDSSGRKLTADAAGALCQDPANTWPTAECMDRLGLRQRIVYQPADRYPWFQLIEIGLLLAASGALTVTIRRQLTRYP